MDTNKPKFISIMDFAAMLGIGRTKAYELINEQRIETIRIGRRRLVCRKSAKSFAVSLRRKGGLV